MPNPTDQDRLASKTSGATIFDFAAYRAAAIQAGALRTTEDYRAPAALGAIVMFIIVLMILAHVFARR